MKAYLAQVTAPFVLFVVGALAAPLAGQPLDVPPTPGPGQRIDERMISCYRNSVPLLKKGSCLVTSHPKHSTFAEIFRTRTFGRGGLPTPILWRDDRSHCGAGLQPTHWGEQGSIRLSFADIDEYITDIMTKCEREGLYGGGHYNLSPSPFRIDLYPIRSPWSMTDAINMTTTDGNASGSTVNTTVAASNEASTA